MYRSERRVNVRRSTYAPSQPRKTNPIRFATVILVAVAMLIVAATATYVARHHTTPQAAGTAKTLSSQQNPSAAPPATSGFNNHQYSLTDSASLWVIVNKQHPLSPKTYTPTDLVVPGIPLRSNITSTEKYVRADMAKALETMVTAAAAQGVHFNLQSGYRSYNFQVTLYNGYVQSQGQAVADRQSARPGYSEHQTGLAADLGGTTQPSCNVAQCFANTPEGTWLAANAYRYGFLIRYTASKESTTGYEYEPWHIRYIGTVLAAEMHSKQIETLEEFFGVSGGVSY